MLYKDVVEKLQLEYADLLKKALPYIDIDPKTLEIVDHGLSKGEADQDFLDCGLGISVRVIKSREGSPVGYTGKFLVWLPGQFMPEHRHKDIIAVPKNTDSEFLLNTRVARIENFIRDFSGIKGLDNENYNFFVPADDNVLLREEEMPSGCRLIYGKAETFDVIYGDGSFFLPGEETKDPKYPVPESQKEHVKHRNELYLKAGDGRKLHLDPNTPHSARAGPNGMVAIEYSLPSRDEADIFTHPCIKRETEVKKRN